MDVTAWLQSLGLERYVPAFRENRIGADVLPNLTAEDLTDLGATSVGDRRRLLDAIAALRATPARDPGLREAERRPLTVMFCDLVGSTALSTQFDPEDLRPFINLYQRAVTATVGRFGGFTAQYQGDGVVTYFGYPQAHEDDAERSIRAGLAVIETVSKLPGPVALRVRIGIATGIAVVGDLIGEGASEQRAVLGETPNLASRLQGLAEPNMIVIADNTRRQIGGLFNVSDLGLKSLAGFPVPQRAWRVLGESAVMSRFEALRTGTSPLVGRAEEFDLLARRWGQAKAGEGRVVLISGEPGIGKSRLAAAFNDHIASEPHTRIRYFCSPHRQDSALYPIIVQLERAAGFARDDTAQQKRAKLAVLLAPEDVVLFLDLLSVPGESQDPPITSQRKRQRTFEALLRQLESLARRNPITLVFEDAHWADPTTRELLDLMVDRVPVLPILLIVTARPEFNHEWAGRPEVSVMALNRLGENDGAAMARSVAGGSELPADLIAEIVERTDGVPLFVEELTKAVLERAVTPDAVPPALPLAGLSVPATLHASLMARLDRLGPEAKEVAQVGSVLGREFTYELIVPVAQRPEVELRAGLDRLSDSGLLFCRGVVPDASYWFKHAMVQDVAYGSLLRERRRELHGRAGDTLAAAVGRIRDAEPEIVAYHLQNASRADEAIPFWREAGTVAVRRTANREAIEHFRRALARVQTWAEDETRWRAELAVLSQLASPAMVVFGPSSPEAGKVIERAAEVGRRLEGSADIAPAIANLWFFNNSRGRFDLTAEIAADVMRIARETGDPEVLLQAHHCYWATSFIVGRFLIANEHIEAGAAIYDETRHAHHRHVYMGHDPGACLLAYQGITNAVLGHPTRGARAAGDCVARALRLSHPPSLVNSLGRAVEVHITREDTAAVILMCEQLLRLSDEHGLFFNRGWAHAALGWGLSRSGNMEEGIVQAQEGLKIMDELGHRLSLPSALGLLADSFLAVGQYDQGLAFIGRALDVCGQNGDRAYVSRHHRIRGELLLHAEGSGSEEAERALRQALSVARQQDARSFELHAATSLARLWAERGRRSEARDLLAPVYGWFTEGFDEAYVREAKGLLDELA